MKVFVDTNVVIDLLEKREPFYQAAVQIFTLAYEKRITLYISPFTYATASYLLRKQGAERVKLLLRNLRQLSCVSNADERVIDDALASSFPDYEDALQYYSAISQGVDVIITRNLKDFQYATIPVMLPNVFLMQTI